MSSESVKVCDSELEQLACIAECWDNINAILERYVDMLEKVSTNAVKAGHIHSTIMNLYYHSSRFCGYAGGLGEETAKYARNFISKIEDIDLELNNEV